MGSKISIFTPTHKSRRDRQQRSAKTQHKYIKRGIEQVSLLEEASDQHHHEISKQSEEI